MHRSGPVSPKHASAAKLRQCDKQFWSAPQAIAATELSTDSANSCDLDVRIGGSGAANHHRAKSDAGRDHHCGDAFPNPSPKPKRNGDRNSVVNHLYRSGFRHRVHHGDLSADSAGRGAKGNLPGTMTTSIWMAGVLFTPNPTTCTSNCAVHRQCRLDGGPNKRTCGVALTAVPDTSVPSKTILPLYFPDRCPAGGGDHRCRHPLQLRRRFLDLASSERFLSRVPPISRPAMCNPAPPPDISNITPRAATMA